MNSKGKWKNEQQPLKTLVYLSLLALLQDCRMGEHVMWERARQAHEGEDNVLVLARLPFYLERNRTFKARNSFYAPKYNFSPEDFSG